MKSLNNYQFFNHINDKYPLLDFELQLAEKKILDPLVDHNLLLIIDKILRYQNYQTYKAPKINYPVVTLGSRVAIKTSDDNYTVDIVGIKELGQNNETEYCTPSSPIAKAVIGKQIGETALLTIHKPIEIKIISIDQTSVQDDLKKQLASY